MENILTAMCNGMRLVEREQIFSTYYLEDVVTGVVLPVAQDMYFDLREYAHLQEILGLRRRVKESGHMVTYRYYEDGRGK